MTTKTVLLISMATALGCYDSNSASTAEDTDSETTGEQADTLSSTDDSDSDPAGDGADTSSGGNFMDSEDSESDEIDSETPLLRCTTEEMIDDMEDGSGVICATDNRNGVWYVFNDAIAEQYPPVTEPGVPIEISNIPGGREESTRAIHTYGQEILSDEDSYKHWGAGVGIDLAYNDGDYELYDASAYKGISFWARSETGETIEVRISTADTTLVEYGGHAIESAASDCWFEPHAATKSLSKEWKLYEVYYSQLRSECLAEFRSDELTNIQFYWANQPTNYDPTLDFDFWIDDVSFVTTIPCCENSPPECKDEWPFTDPVLENEITRNLPDDGKPLCEAFCFDSSFIISGVDVGTLDGLECYYWLTGLLITDSIIGDISALSALTELTTLNLSGSEIESIVPIGELTNLELLALENSRVGDISPVASLDKLEQLNAANADIDDLSVLSGLSNLKFLYLSNNRIEDITPLAGLQNLQSLSLSNNIINDLSSMEDLQAANLLYLDLRNNSISDLTPLADAPLPDPLYLYLEGNPIDCETQSENIEALTERGVFIIGIDCP